MRVVILIIFLLSPNLVAQQVNVRAEINPQYDALFTRTSGWSGGDGAFSVALSSDLTLWLYSDSWIGKVRKNRHVDARMINNAVGIQSGKDPTTATTEFFWGPKKNGKPTALFIPDDGKGKFWIFDAALTKKGLYLFLQRTEEMADGGFRHSGTSLGFVSNPLDRPSTWRVTQTKVPFGHFSVKGDTLFGSAVLLDKGFVYVYGTSEDVENGWHTKHMIVTRIPENDIAEFSKWRFYTKSEWRPDYSTASRIADNVANEYSVSYQAALGRYVMVYTEGGLSKNIMLRTAPTPIGEWSSPQVIYKCPEMDWDKRIFCYAAKAHPSLSEKPDELIVTYVANSTDFFHQASEARIYRPRFIKLKFEKGPHP